MIPALRSLVYVGLAAVLSSCIAGEINVPASASAPIFYGEPDDSLEHAAIVALTSGPGTGSYCTGTLITHRFVLTAAHCVEGVNAASVYVFFGNDVSAAGQTVRASSLYVHPTYDNKALVGDIALLRLEEAAPTTIAPIPHLPSSLGMTPADTGAAIDHVGFGDTENRTSGEKLIASNVVGLVCQGAAACDAYTVGGGFYYEMATGGPCLGDSGGPALLIRSGVEYAAGITSYGDRKCTQFGVDTIVSEYADWVSTTVAAAGDAEVCENQVDDDGDELVGCDDPDCADDIVICPPPATDDDEEDPPPQGGDTQGGGPGGDNPLPPKDGGCQATQGSSPQWLALLLLGVALIVRKRRQSKAF